ncbi:MAG: hypothetical protein IPO27_17745 [Bacteroidetes bacterium]|nr:hypothetical protein [Bacteroidota bacterium]
MQQIKLITAVFVGLLVLSGITAFPLQTEMEFLLTIINWFPMPLRHWIETVAEGIMQTWSRYPYIAYGTDWLAFAHIMIGLAFVGIWRNPVQNIWICEWAMLCCLCVFPLAFICGPIRGIPFFHQLIDCSFGIFGLVPLYILRKKILQLKSIIKND